MLEYYIFIALKMFRKVRNVGNRQVNSKYYNILERYYLFHMFEVTFLKQNCKHIIIHSCMLFSIVFYNDNLMTIRWKELFTIMKMLSQCKRLKWSTSDDTLMRCVYFFLLFSYSAIFAARCSLSIQLNFRLKYNDIDETEGSKFRKCRR